jgi:exodeoxyribonuclease V alpha subunit
MAYQDALEGEIVGFTFKAPDGAFAVVKVRPAGQEEQVVVGPLAHLLEGQRIVARGQWVTDLRFGRQFKVEQFLVEEPRTMRGMERMLAAALPGVGDELARRIVEAFGLDTIAVLDHQPERLLEIAGIGAKTLERIREQWDAEVVGREVTVLLRGHDVPPAACRKVIERFGKGAPAVVAREPYRLTEIPGIGFRTADTIARANGVARDDPARLAAALRFLLDGAEDEGHCHLPEAVVLDRMAGLDCDPARAFEALDRAVAAGQLVRRGAVRESERPVLSPRLDLLEGRIANELRARAQRAFDGGNEMVLDALVEQAERVSGLTLAPGQRDALATALANRVAVITGGPGTGKTTIVKALLAAARARNETWRCAAPTGRAARRLTETSGQEARTIHRLLEIDPATMGFRRTRERPLEVDGVLVDEASMVDLPLFASLLDALPAGARLVLVGDHDQLPSVGPGRVLGDVIDSGVVPVARLTEVYRQALDSGIIRNALRILKGRPPQSAEKDEEGEGRRDCFVVEREVAEDLRDTLLEMVQTRLPRNGLDPLGDVQVLCPMHAGPIGTQALNAALQEALNPAVPDVFELKHGKRVFRAGDRVIQLRNDYDREVFNGDVGRVTEALPAALTVDFDGREVMYALDALDALDLAYAMSVHKSQGSEYPAVVLVLHHAHWVMLRRNLAYTGLTRARRFACILGSHRGIGAAVARAGGDERYTLLASRLRGA